MKRRPYTLLEIRTSDKLLKDIAIKARHSACFDQSIIMPSSLDEGYGIGRGLRNRSRIAECKAGLL